MKILNKFLIAVASVGLCAAAVPVMTAAPAPVPAKVAVVNSAGNAGKAVSSANAQSGQTGLDLVVLVDESLAQRVDIQLKEVGDFIQKLPPSTRVAVAYANYGGVKYVQDFTTDHEKAARAFHIPSAFSGSSNGLYDSVTDLVKKWPATENRRVVLLISDGIDTTSGRFDTEPNQNTVLQRAIDHAEKGNVTIDSIYAAGSGASLHNKLLVLNGQGCLEQLAKKTGGNAYFEGTETPISFKPFLEQVAKSLGQ